MLGALRFVFGGGLAALAVFALLLTPGAAHTVTHHYHHRHHRRHAAWHGPVHEAILIDADTGAVLSQSNADASAYPASLTKMMTLYLTFEALNRGRIGLDTRLPVSALAARQQPTKLGLKPGSTVSVRDLILGIVTRSANDAAVVLAEGIGGSQAAFTRRMTATARRLGMTRTVYVNASGLPDPRQRTTARDVARLALALHRNFPHYWHYFATREFDFRGQTVTSHNHLLDWYPGADGIKTGFIDNSGFNLAASAVRHGKRLIGVIFGGRTAHSRDEAMAALLNRGFAELAAARHGTRLASAGTIGSRPHQRRSSAAEAASRLAAHLSPIARAEAATRPAERASADRHRHDLAARDRDWSVQLGAFGSKAAAREIARRAARLPVARGRQVQIVKPDKLYRARLVSFSRHGARHACARLARHDFSCLVVKSTRFRVAASPRRHWSVQLGAFRAKKRARRLAHAATHLKVAQGRPVRVVQPADGGLYRTRVANFTEAGAHTACRLLKRKNMPCAVVPTIRLADR